MSEISYDAIIDAWQKKNICTQADLDVALSDYRIFFAFNSNSIEGAGVTLHQDST